MSIDCMNRVWKQSQHKGTPLLAMLALADRANDAGVCWPGVADIAVRARTEKRHAKRVIKALYESGELFFDEGGGRHRTNLYLVCIGMDDAQILDTLTHRQWFQLTPLEARVVLSKLRERQAQFAAENSAENGDTEDTLSAPDCEDENDETMGELAEKGDMDARKGDTEDTLSGKGDTGARKGDILVTKGVMDARKGDTGARKGDIAVSPESSLTINEPTFNLKEPGALKFLWKAADVELRLSLARAIYTAHFEPLRPLRYVNGSGPPVLILATPRAASLEWLNARYRERITQIVCRLAGGPLTIQFEICTPDEPAESHNE